MFISESGSAHKHAKLRKIDRRVHIISMYSRAVLEKANPHHSNRKISALSLTKETWGLYLEVIVIIAVATIVFINTINLVQRGCSVCKGTCHNPGALCGVPRTDSCVFFSSPHRLQSIQKHKCENTNEMLRLSVHQPRLVIRETSVCTSLTSVKMVFRRLCCFDILTQYFWHFV